MGKMVIHHDFPDRHLEELGEIGPQLRVVKCTDKEELARHLADAEILITFRLPDGMLQPAPGLRWIQALTAGVDHLPLAEIRTRGILLTSCRGIHRIQMAEYAIAAMIGLARSFSMMFRNQVHRKWDRKVPQGEINGSTLGILGLGDIGREIARKASFFDMKVIGIKRDPRPVAYVEKVYSPQEMAEVFRQSDYIVNLLPGTPETKKIINRDLFVMMKPSACFINMGRGSTMDEKDLVEALRSGTVRALVSDVFEEEPLPEENPLWDMENVLITPHICGVSPKYEDRAMEIIRHNLQVYLGGTGEMINVVEPDKPY